MSTWLRAAAVADCPPGTLLGVVVGGEPVALANVDGDFYALVDQCSHEDLPLSDGDLEDKKLECIYHGAQFDVCSGRALSLPAIRPVKTFEVEVRDEDVYVCIGD